MHEGDIFIYGPEQRHCREGMAVVVKYGDRLVAKDTYWNAGGRVDSMCDHILTDVELETAEFAFNMFNDVNEIMAYQPKREWEKYAPNDRFRVTSQHGLRVHYFTKIGAVPSIDTQIENARAAVEKAEAQVRSAQWSLENRRRELAEFEAQRANA
ncbi:hypothetical protein [Aeromicrobium sp. 179-A 4D2 NHS]|uniref:hypothetical protein n=1 Tax=Aeromicrobium sp. 179-A 4D2 NHS TaxID=3142375 RepID=UPI0039A3361B